MTWISRRSGPVRGRERAAGARIRTWELLREQILSLPPLAARPPRRALGDEPGRVIPLPVPRRRAPSPPRGGEWRGPLRRAERNGARGRAPPLRFEERDGREYVDFGRIAGTCAPGDFPALGSEPCGLPPKKPNTHGSRAPDTRAGAERCNACRPSVPARRSGRPVRRGRPTLPARPARTGRIFGCGRFGPSRRSGARDGPRASRLGLLADGAVRRGPRDHGPAVNAVLAARRGLHRPRRAGREGYHVGGGDCPRGVREGRLPRWPGRPARRHARGGRGGCRRARARSGGGGPGDGGGRGVHLRQREPALRAEKGAVGR